MFQLLQLSALPRMLKSTHQVFRFLLLLLFVLLLAVLELELSKQERYYLSHTPSPFFFLFFRQGLAYLSGASLGEQLPCLPLPKVGMKDVGHRTQPHKISYRNISFIKTSYFVEILTINYTRLQPLRMEQNSNATLVQVF
jgi:hypothetical protein